MKKKKRQYDYRVEKGTFTPLVFSVSGTSAPECQTFLRSLFTKIGGKEVKDIVMWQIGEKEVKDIVMWQIGCGVN